MQCPTCGQEFPDQSACPICDPPASATAAPTHESNIPAASDLTPSAADSPADPLLSLTATGSAGQLAVAPAASANVEQILRGNTLDAKGDLSVIGQLNQNIYQGDLAGKLGEEKSLYSLTKRRPQKQFDLPPALIPELTTATSRLRGSGLLFVCCAYKRLAFEAGYAASAGLRLANPDRDRVLIHSDALQRHLEFTVQKLLDHWPDHKDAAAVVVDAHSPSAETFADSVIGDTTWVDVVNEELKNKRLSLTVIVSPAYAEKRLQQMNQDSGFGYWAIPFLKPFLEQHYPTNHQFLDAEISRQRQRRVWQEDETAFCQQLLNYHERGQLQETVAQGGPSADPEQAAAALLKGATPVEKTVLFAAAFFHEITPLEFGRVVQALLAGRTVSLSPVANSAGPHEAAVNATPRIALTGIWEDEKDIIFTKWLRVAAGNSEAIQVVSLADPLLREPLRRLFEKEHRYYLIDRFRALQEQGIFFDPSVRLAENAIHLAVQMANLHPDEFNERWLTQLIDRLGRCLGTAVSDEALAGDAMFQFLRNSPGALTLAVGRLADVLRRMLELPTLKGMAQSSFEHLLQGGYHEETLWLIKRLQFTPEFDQLHWIRQLLHRADARTRQLTYHYLFSYLKQLGNGVYEGLLKIESWLPASDRAPETYSQFDHFVLRLLIQYCLETVQSFDPKHYGSWPSRYPLFATREVATARQRVALVTGWLLHPGIEATLSSVRMGGTQMTLVGALLVEWAFILRGPEVSPTVGVPNLPAGDGASEAETQTAAVSPAELSSAAFFDLLFAEFAARIDLRQRLKLLKYWNQLDRDLLQFLGSLPSGSPLRSQLGWKLNLVRQLISKIKEPQTVTANVVAAGCP